VGVQLPVLARDGAGAILRFSDLFPTDATPDDAPPFRRKRSVRFAPAGEIAALFAFESGSLPPDSASCQGRTGKVQTLKACLHAPAEPLPDADTTAMEAAADDEAVLADPDTTAWGAGTSSDEEGEQQQPQQAGKEADAPVAAAALSAQRRPEPIPAAGPAGRSRRCGRQCPAVHARSASCRAYGCSCGERNSA